MPPVEGVPVFQQIPTEQRKSRLLLSALAILLIIAVCVAAYLLYPKIRTQLALQGIGLADLDYKPSTIKEMTLGGLREAEFPFRGIRDYSRSEGGEVVLVSYPDSTAEEVVLLGGEPKVLVSDETVKAGVSINKAGTHVVYATLIESIEGQVPLLIPQWSVQLLNIENGQSTDLGPGFAPEFIEREEHEYVVFTSPRGVTFFDTETFVARTHDLLNAGHVDFAVTVSSPDGRYLAARNPLTGKYDVYAVDLSEGVPSLSPRGSTPAGISDVLWKGSSLYGVGPFDGEKVAVWKWRIDDFQSDSSKTPGKSIGSILVPEGDYRLIRL